MLFRPFFIGGEHLFDLLERRGVSYCVDRGDGCCWSVLSVIASSVERSLQVVCVVNCYVRLSVLWLRVGLIRTPPLLLVPN